MIFITLLEAMECWYENLRRDGPLEITGGREVKNFPRTIFFKAHLTAGVFSFSVA